MRDSGEDLSRGPNLHVDAEMSHMRSWDAGIIFDISKFQNSGGFMEVICDASGFKEAKRSNLRTGLYDL